MTFDSRETNGRKPANPIGMGAPIALLIIAGVIVGGLLGQPSVGFLAGIGAGAAIALAAWAVSRRK